MVDLMMDEMVVFPEIQVDGWKIGDLVVGRKGWWLLEGPARRTEKGCRSVGGTGSVEGRKAQCRFGVGHASGGQDGEGSGVTTPSR